MLTVGAGRHRQGLVLFGTCRKGRDDVAQVRFGQLKRLAQSQHQRGIDDILTCGPPMHMLSKFRCLHFGAELGQQSRYRHAVFPRRGRNRAGIDLNFQRGAVDRGGAQFGDDAKAALYFGQRAFDQQHRADRSGVGKQPPRVTGVEKLCEQGAVKDAGGHGLPRNDIVDDPRQTGGIGKEG